MKINCSAVTVIVASCFIGTPSSQSNAFCIQKNTAAIISRNWSKTSGLHNNGRNAHISIGSQHLHLSASKTQEEDTTRTSSQSKEPFVNDGPFVFMEKSLSILGFAEGKTTFYGPPIPLDPASLPSESEAARRRQVAKEEMVNIGQEERDRRAQGSEIAAKVSVAYALFSALWLDDGDISGNLARFAIVLPLFFTFGYKMSSEEGL